MNCDRGDTQTRAPANPKGLWRSAQGWRAVLLSHRFDSFRKHRANLHAVHNATLGLAI